MRQCSKNKLNQSGGGPRGIMVKSDGLRNGSKQVHTPIALLRSLSGKYLGKGMNPLLIRAMS